MKHQLFRRIIAGCLSVLMLVTSPMSTAAETGGSNFKLAEAGAGRTATASGASPSRAAKQEAAFEQSREADGVIVTVKADPGVFPADAALSVKAVSKAKELKKVGEAVAKEEPKNIAGQYVFDISVLSGGEEVEPDNTKGSVQVSFALAEVHDENSELEVFHVTEEAGTLNAESLDVQEETAENEDNAKRGEETVVTVETGGFSVYVVAFTYDDLSYTFSENSVVRISDLMNAVGLTGEAEDARLGSTAALSLEKDGNSADWILKENGSFEEETLTLTVNGKEYDVIVKDSVTNPLYWIIDTGAHKLTISKRDIRYDGGHRFDGDAQLSSAPWTGYTDQFTQVVIDTAGGAPAPKYMNNWFKGNTSLISVDLRGLDTSNMTCFNSLFQGCTHLTSVNLTGLNTENVTNMTSMFYGCSSLAAVDVSDLDTQNVTEMVSMFNNCTALKELDLSDFSFASVTDVRYMFQNTTSLETLDMSSFHTQGAVSVDGLFKNSTVADLDLTGANTVYWTVAYDYSSEYPFTNVSYLKRVTLGKDWTNKYQLPTPSSITIPGADGYWHTADDESFTPGDINTNNSTVTYLAVMVFYKVQFNGNGATSGSAETVNASSLTEIELPGDAFSRTGYHLTGWKDNNGTSYEKNQTVSNLAKTQGETVTMTAQWAPNTYKIAFSANGGTGTAMTVKAATYDKAVTLPVNTYTRTEKVFVGWNTRSDGTGTSFKDKASVRNLTSDNGKTVTLYAQWKTYYYSIKFDKNGGTGSMTTLTKRIYGRAYTLTANKFTRSGKAFAGWNTKANGKGTSYKDGASVQNLTKTDGGTVTLYAQWKDSTYTIKFNGNGATSGTMANMTNRVYTTTYTLTKNKFKKTGMTFIGWNTRKDGSGTSYANAAKVSELVATDKGSITLYAVWGYTVTYNLNKGTNNKSNPAALKKGAAITLKAPTRTGYTFGGWYTNSKCTVKFSAKTLTKNITVYAKWTANAYTIKYNANGGTGTMSSTSAKYGTKVALRANAFTRSGYKFTGWNTTKSGTGKSYTDKQKVTNLIAKSKGTVVLYAQWVKLLKTRVTLTSVSKLKYNKNVLTYSVSEESGNKSTGVEIWRSTKKSSGYTLIGTTTDKKTFTDSTAVAGTTYYYKLRAYKTASGKTTYAETYSSVKNIKTALKPQIGGSVGPVYNNYVKVKVSNYGKYTLSVGGSASGANYGLFYPDGSTKIPCYLYNSALTTKLSKQDITSGYYSYACYKYSGWTVASYTINKCVMAFFIEYDGCSYAVAVDYYGNGVFQGPAGSESVRLDESDCRITLDGLEYTPDFTVEVEEQQ